ncbi:MAG: response regulator [Micavibrio aeruginosavorus]|uniref:Response regulator n=1 Tax=Micavibrio aeruginosavorus TaxID=349221 RepID=A0A7T5UFS4_9BACT|nr:MAG: response regulator [Micavibrio aeruginosavorus]
MAFLNTHVSKILVIDDDELIRMTCRNILKKMNYTVIEAENGVKGLEQFRKEAPQIVITDMLMPDKEGLETISEIRAKNAKVKIIAMSGGGATQNMNFLNLAKQIGADMVLSKPFKPEELMSAIKGVLR